jgi:hypothetical protein
MLADLCIRRPVFATMLIMALVVLGLFSYAGLGVDLYPNVDLPTVTITVTLNGASVEEMETAVTKPIEEAINTIDGIDELRAVIKEGVAVIAVVRARPRRRSASPRQVTVLSHRWAPVAGDQNSRTPLRVDHRVRQTQRARGERDRAQTGQEDIETASVGR